MIDPALCHAIAAHLPVPVFFKGGDGRYLAVNRAFEEFTGLSAARLIGRPLGEIYPADQAEVFAEADRRLMAEGGEQRYETAISTSGTPRPVTVHKARFDGDEGYGIIGLFLDLTPQKEAEAELRRERQLLEQVLETLPASVFWVDRDLILTGSNSRFATGAGHPDPEAVIGRPLAEVCGWLADQSRMEALARLATGGDSASVESVRAVDPAGATRTLESYRVPLRAADGQVGGLLGMLIDVTEQEELKARVEETSNLESIGQLAAGVAHEVNTPTQFVGDNVAFLRSGVDDLLRVVEAGRTLVDAVRGGGDVAEALADHDAAVAAADLDFLMEELPAAGEQAQTGMNRVSHIVRAMKDLSHPGSEVMEPVDVNRLIDSTVVVAASEWKYVAEVDLDLDPELPLVVCHGFKLSQAVLNLIVNAAHAITDALVAGHDAGRSFSASGHLGQIAITTASVDGEAVITVADTGSGIPPEVRDRIFEPFFTTKAVGRGSGQGLPLVLSVVTAHGGSLDLDSEPGLGTTFTLRLPLGGPDRSPTTTTTTTAAATASAPPDHIV